MGNNCSACCSPPGSQSCCDTCEQICCVCPCCCVSFQSCWSRMFGRRPPELHLPTKPDPDERPKPSALQDLRDTNVAAKEYLAVTGWDWQRSENGAAHRTADYHLMDAKDSGGAVVRRGQPFSLRLTTNRRYDANRDKIGFVFTVSDCKNPNFGNGTQEGVSVGGEMLGGWSAKIHSVTDSSISLELSSPPTSIIGAWRVEVDISSDDATHNFTCPYPLYIVFNPWCPEDATFIEGEEERKEYVLQQTGLIWRGTHNRLRPCAWHYAQFHEHVLQCVLMMLTEVCRMSTPNRADPAKVARAISAGINSPDDSGVLVGNWSGKYEGGTAPTEWNGSVNILTQFYQTKTPVKFGQCWVFSGVLTTACRTIGLPCRPVTNFSSAHDTHNSLTIDYFFDDKGETIERLNSDSIWNFHVWNEVWMKRPDLGEEYGGWQIVDATPQEESDGQYRCGPTSQVAVKRGEIHLPFDTPFVYAEVNADKLFWKYRGASQPMKLLGRKTGGVGLNLSTKAVGRYVREDITDQYKHNEDSTEERNVMRDALRRCENVFARYYLNEEIEDIEFDLLLLDDIVIGQPFTISVVIMNKSDKDHDVSVVLRADSTLYTGAVKELVKKEEFKRTIKAKSEEKVITEVTFEEYYNKLVDQCALNVACLAKVDTTDFEYFAQDDFRMRKPDIKITPKTPFMVGQPTTCKLSFTNPLPMALTKAVFYVIATKCESQFIKVKEDIPAGGEAQCEATLTPSNAGEITVTASFLSKQLEDVDGYLAAQVLDENGKPVAEENDVEEDKNEAEDAV
ncbi:annulin isoform X2 [Hyalella azteca]|uniref:protein-glutamine gamma-glutamyltransferase n=1 Tax=Hyalella azteca TaxID=294128 RepID=A0A979FNG1_HYAAZ|nr:annulin isoform X2 [Hyalella azteca]